MIAAGLTSDELDAYVSELIDKDTKEMLKSIEGGGTNGRKTESPEELGFVGEHCGSGCVFGKNVLQS